MTEMYLCGYHESGILTKCYIFSFYGCETWSLTLREEKKLRAFENMVLRRIFGPRRDEITGGMEETA